MIRREDALEFHAGERPGKLAVTPTKACLSPREIRLAYLPGATYPAAEIAADPAASYRYTARGNLVGVVTNGTAVPGLGNVGPAAAKPMLEGIGVLFKQLADIDVFDLELDAPDSDQLVAAVQMLAPTFGGINLKDLAAPDGLEIYDRLRETMAIPVFHESLYGTAVVAAAALLNALDLADKRPAAVDVVICGAGSVGLGCARLFVAMGVDPERLRLYDERGLIAPDRPDLNRYQRVFARGGAARSLAEGVRGADVLVGASVGGVFDAEHIRAMARFPVVMALAAPEPEIEYAVARAARRDVIAATSRGQDPNAIVDLLSFPYIFRGALDVQAARITEGMMLAAARALAELAREEVVEEVCRAYGAEAFTFGPEYLLPKAIDPRILARESAAVARQAIAEGVAGRPLEPARYEETLNVRMGTGREIVRQLTLEARRFCPRVVLPEGTHESALRAASILVDEGIARPTLLGEEEVVRAQAERFGLDPSGVTVIDPQRSPRQADYAEAYFGLRGRRGVTLGVARDRVRDPLCFGALMLHTGDADLMIAGLNTHFAESMHRVLEVIGPAPNVQRVSSVHMVLRPKEVIFLADCAVNIEPDAAELAEIALEAAGLVRTLGIEPRVAMLSFSNYGSSDHPRGRMVREATRQARERAPGLMIDGELQLATSRDAGLRARYFPFSDLIQDANLLVFPDLQSGNLALQLLQTVGEAVVIGPILLGTRRPVHLLQYGSGVADVVHLTAVGAVAAAATQDGGPSRSC